MKQSGKPETAKRKNSKNKGSTFEREIAKQLSKWTGHDFHRTPGSGALHWKNDARVVSDIVPSQDFPEWKISVECKCYGKPTYVCDFQSLLNNNATMWRHWVQCVTDAKRESLIPMLITKVTGLRRPVFAVMLESDAKKLGLDDAFPSGSFPHIIVHASSSDVLTDSERRVVIFYLEHLFENFSIYEFLEKLNV